MSMRTQLCVAVVAVLCVICGYVSEAYPLPSDENGLSLPTANEDYFGPRATLTLWQLPKGPVRKILIVLEGMGCLPYVFFDPSPSCRQCKARPEHRQIMMDALARNYAVFVPDWGHDKTHLEEDTSNLVSIFSEWKRGLGLEGVPAVALGISGAGRVLFRLGFLRAFVEAMAFMVCPGQDEDWDAAPSDFPPSIFIHMPKDQAREPKIRFARSTLMRKGVPTKDLVWNEHPITPSWFAESIPIMDLATSTAILEALKRDGFVNENGFLYKDFRTNELMRWDSLVRSWGILPIDPAGENGELMFEEETLWETLVAFAYHTAIGRTDDAMFGWFDGAYYSQSQEPHASS